MKAKLAAETIDGMPVAVYDVSLFPQKTQVGDVQHTIAAMRLHTPNQLGTAQPGDANEQSFNDKLPNHLSIFDTDGAAHRYQHAVVATLGDAPSWQAGADVRSPPKDHLVLFRLDMTPDKKGRTQKLTKAHATVACYFDR